MENKKIKIKNIELSFNPLPYLYGLSGISILGIILILFVFKNNNIFIIIGGIVILGITYSLYSNRCFNCSSFFTIIEDEEKKELLKEGIEKGCIYTSKYRIVEDTLKMKMKKKKLLKKNLSIENMRFQNIFFIVKIVRILLLKKI